MGVCCNHVSCVVHNKGVIARTADQGVRAGAAGQDIIAAIGGQDISGIIAGAVDIGDQTIGPRPSPKIARSDGTGSVGSAAGPCRVALIQGSHALHDGFVVIYWRSLGIGDGAIGVLWSESVAGEVVVFLLVGSFLLNRLGPAGASILAAAGGIVRWTVLAETTSVAAFALVEPLHGLTFALQHLACMRLIAAIVPARLAATAQALYGTVAVGVASALLTLGSGPLYAHGGAGGFWVMAGLCA